MTQRFPNSQFSQHKILISDLTENQVHQDFLEDFEDFPEMSQGISNLEWRNLFYEPKS